MDCRVKAGNDDLTELPSDDTRPLLRQVLRPAQRGGEDGVGVIRGALGREDARAATSAPQGQRQG